jgi:hypothetical protein
MISDNKIQLKLRSGLFNAPRSGAQLIEPRKFATKEFAGEYFH